MSTTETIVGTKIIPIYNASGNDYPCGAIRIIYIKK